MAVVRYQDATRIYPGTKAPAVDKLNLTIDDGEFLVLVGPSGSGKSTACACWPAWKPVTRAPSTSAIAT